MLTHRYLKFPPQEYRENWIWIIHHPCPPNPRNNPNTVGTIVTWSSVIRNHVGTGDDVLFDHHPHYRKMYELRLCTLFNLEEIPFGKTNSNKVVNLPIYTVPRVSWKPYPFSNSVIGGWIYNVPGKRINQFIRENLLSSFKQELEDLAHFLQGNVYTYKISGSINLIGPPFYGEPQELFADILQAAQLHIDEIIHKFLNRQINLNLL